MAGRRGGTLLRVTARETVAPSLRSARLRASVSRSRDSKRHPTAPRRPILRILHEIVIRANATATNNVRAPRACSTREYSFIANIWVLLLGASMDSLTESLFKLVKNRLLDTIYLRHSDFVSILRVYQKFATMKRVLKRLAYYIVPLLIPVIEKLIEDAVKECKKKLSDQLKSESEIIQNQLRSM